MEVWLQNNFFDSINLMSMDTTKCTGSDANSTLSGWLYSDKI